MTFAESIQTCLRKYIDVSGRARRSEYWWFSLFQIIVLVVAALVHEVVYGIVAVALLLPAIAVTARRLHDSGRSGWWMLIAFIPIVGALILLYGCIKAGDAQDNQWGPAAVPAQVAPGAQ